MTKLIGASLNELNSIKNSCQHYVRRCFIRAPCCQNIYACRQCHDNDTKKKCKNKLDRYNIKSIVCGDCYEEQSPSKKCCFCHVVFAEYFCKICNLWTSSKERSKVWHCSKCGFCRIGNRRDFYHCDECEGCYPVVLKETHKCSVKAIHNSCPICLESLFDSTNAVTILEKCGHAIHAHCLASHQRGGYNTRNKCPLCLTVITDVEDENSSSEDFDRYVEVYAGDSPSGYVPQTRAGQLGTAIRYILQERRTRQRGN